MAFYYFSGGDANLKSNYKINTTSDDFFGSVPLGNGPLPGGSDTVIFTGGGLQSNTLTAGEVQGAAVGGGTLNAAVVTGGIIIGLGPFSGGTAGVLNAGVIDGGISAGGTSQTTATAIDNVSTGDTAKVTTESIISNVSQLAVARDNSIITVSGDIVNAVTADPDGTPVEVITIGETATITAANVYSTGTRGLGTMVSGGTLNITGNYDIATTTAGLSNDFRVTAGGKVNSSGLFGMGVRAGDFSDVRVTGAGSILDTVGPVTIGDAGLGSLLLQSAADHTFEEIIIGKQATSNGSGLGVNNTHATIASDLTIGDDGVNAAAGVSNSGTLNVNGDVVAGKQAGASGSVSASGGGTLNALGSQFLVGDNGRGTLTAAGNGHVFATTMIVGNEDSGGTSQLNVNTNGDVSVADLTIARNGLGALNILTGGEVVVAGDMLVSAGTKMGTVSVADANSRLLATNITLGNGTATVDECGDWTYTGTPASFTVNNQGYVAVLDTLTLDNIEGHPLTINNGASMTVGADSGPVADTLTIAGGGTIIGHGVISMTKAGGGLGTVINQGALIAHEGILQINANLLTGAGTTHLDDHSSIDVLGQFDGPVQFDSPAGSTFVLRRPDLFTGVFNDLDPHDTIYLPFASLQAATGSAQVSHTDINGTDLIVTMKNGNELTFDLGDPLFGRHFAIRDLADAGAGAGPGVGLTVVPLSVQIQTGIDGTPSGNPYIDSLVAGWAKWNPLNSITYFFGDPVDVEAAHAVHDETVTLPCDDDAGGGGAVVNAWAANEMSAVVDALAAYAAVSGLKFQQAATVADANMVFWKHPDLAPPGVLASAEQTYRRPDANFWLHFDASEWTANNLMFGGDGRHTILQQIGLTLGLAHSHDGGAEPDASVFPGVVPTGAATFSTGTNGQNQGVYTVMSSNTGWDGVAPTPPPEDFGAQGALGAYDIAALQLLYGANNTFHNGNDTYTLPTANAVNTGWRSIWDAGGTDTISNAGANINSLIDLNTATLNPANGVDAGGPISSANGILGGYTIANNVVIENATGGNVSDIIIGNDIANTLDGGNGADTIFGAGGIDTINGGAGDDGLLGEAGNDVVRGGTGNDRLGGNAGMDMLSGQQNADDFIFHAPAVAEAQLPTPIFDRVTDYDQGNSGIYTQGESDQVDLSDILSAAYNEGAGEPVGRLVRAVVDGSNQFARLQVDVDGQANNLIWTTIARMDGLRAGNIINVILDQDQPQGVNIPVIELGRPPNNDFDGDSRSDVLFNIPGVNFNSNYEWQLNDRSLLAAGPIDLYDKTFNVQLIGDYNGDGKADVLFRNPTTGGVWEWQLDGFDIINQGAVDVGDPAFHILGAGDFNGDTKHDVLFRNNAGFLFEWEMDGLHNTGKAIGPLAPVWHVQGTGDFNGDGKDDILLRNISAVANENGAFFLWQMNGNVIASQGGIERPPTTWKTLGIGDFDGDGMDDFAVRNVSNTPDNGAVWVYLMNGTAIKAQGAAGIADAATWQLQEIGDFNGDNKDDILFRNPAGYFYSWDMNGTHIQSEGLLQGGAQWAHPSLTVVKPFWDLV